jgi:hypothetical protein
MQRCRHLLTSYILSFLNSSLFTTIYLLLHTITLSLSLSLPLSLSLQSCLIGCLLNLGHGSSAFDLSAQFLHPRGLLEAMDLDLDSGMSVCMYVSLSQVHQLTTPYRYAVHHGANIYIIYFTFNILYTILRMSVLFPCRCESHHCIALDLTCTSTLCSPLLSSTRLSLPYLILSCSSSFMLSPPLIPPHLSPLSSHIRRVPGPQREVQRSAEEAWRGEGHRGDADHLLLPAVARSQGTPYAGHRDREDCTEAAQRILRGTCSAV